MNRRQLLLGSLSGGAGVLAGCPSLLGQTRSTDGKPQLEVFVASGLDESVRVTITASRGSTEFFSDTYRLGPGEGDESKSFVGTPTEVRVSIQNGRAVTREFSIPESCDSPELNVTLEAEEIMVTNGCTSS